MARTQAHKWMVDARCESTLIIRCNVQALLLVRRKKKQQWFCEIHSYMPPVVAKKIWLTFSHIWLEQEWRLNIFLSFFLCSFNKVKIDHACHHSPGGYRLVNSEMGFALIREVSRCCAPEEVDLKDVGAWAWTSWEWHEDAGVGDGESIVLRKLRPASAHHGVLGRHLHAHLPPLLLLLAATVTVTGGAEHDVARRRPADAVAEALAQVLPHVCMHKLLNGSIVHPQMYITVVVTNNRSW